MGWVRAILTNFDTFAGPIVTLLYPLIASIKAIESPSKLDDQQWLTYWILYSFITLVEMSLWQVFYWIPLWGKVKFFATCWLVLPQFNGAAYMYDYFVRKKLLKQGSGDDLISRHLMRGSTELSVQHYINTYGEDALERVIVMATKDGQKYRVSPTSSPTEKRHQRY